ncbi:MAG: hypothetical protein F6K32_26120 [Desertifilum sp. SIO1I2]|nr:hypothetical protein [Desertifilum sp. SIO1I2]
MKKWLFVVGLNSALLIGGCVASSESSTPQSHVFNPSQVETGDRILGLEVTSVDVSPYLEGYTGTAKFKGEVTLSGKFVANDSHFEGATGVPCFYVDETSATQLPRFVGDERISWFCFDNPEVAKTAFSENNLVQENAKIVIDNYQIVYAPSDVVNQATFKRIVE